MNNHLITTSFLRERAHDADHWLISPSCINKELDQDDPNNKIIGIIANPWLNEIAVNKGYEDIENYKERLLADMVLYLNGVHGVEKSAMYWRIIIGPWLLFYVLIFYDRYSRLLAAEKQIGKFSITRVNLENEAYPQSTYSFCNLGQSSEHFNLGIYNRIAKALGYERINKKDYKNEVCSESNAGNRIRKNSIFDYLSITLVRARMFLNKNKFTYLGEVHLSLKQQIALSCLSLCNMLPIGRMSISRHSIVSERQKSKRWEFKRTTKFESTFEQILYENIKYYIPESFMESYEAIQSSVKWYIGKHRSNDIITSSGWCYNENIKVLAAELKESKGQLIIIQHGGDYGVRKYHIQEKHETSIADKYVTWGWRRTKDKNIVPGFITREIVPSTAVYNESKENILYVSDYQPRFSISRLQSYEVSLNLQRRFFEVLSPKIQALMTIRLHSIDGGWNRKDRIRGVSPHVQFSDQTYSFQSELKKSRIYVADHLSTTYIEALSSNIPTILYWDPLAYQVRDEAIIYFDEFRKQKILHDTPESAAKWLETIYESPNKWWLTSPCQNAVRKFCYHFARSTSGYGIYRWKKLFQ